MNTRIRRVRVAGKVNPKDIKNAQAKLQLIAGHYRTLALTQAAIAKEEAELFVNLKSLGLPGVEVDGATAEIVRSPGKAQNIIDPKALQKKLDPADFFQCVSVSVTKAKTFLGEKELARITTTIPGTTGDPKLKVTVK